MAESAAGRPRGLEAPLRAIRVTGARLRTLGGLVVDAHARVLDPAGQAIRGLYATGGVTAGLAAEASAPRRSGLDALTALGLGRLAALDVIAAAAATRRQERRLSAAVSRASVRTLLSATSGAAADAQVDQREEELVERLVHVR